MQLFNEKKKKSLLHAARSEYTDFYSISKKKTVIIVTPLTEPAKCVLCSSEELDEHILKVF